jgi:drug/metabolite transporter (DMT)-like permease
VLVGIALALGSAACYGVGPIFTRLGMRKSIRDNGHFMTVFINTACLGTCLTVVPAGDPDVEGLAGFIVAGALTGWLGRRFMLSSIRTIGPSRQGVLLAGAPVVSAVAGWLILGETLIPLEGLGAVIILSGFITLLTSSDRVAPLPIAQDWSSCSSANEEEAISRRKSQGHGFLQGVTAAVLLGIGIVMRKWGLLHYPNVFMGAFAGAATSLTLVTFGTLVSGRLRPLLQDNLHPLPWWFVAAGVATTAGILLQFMALLATATWLVALLQGSQGLWTLGWSALFLRNEEYRGPSLYVSLLLTTIGVVVIVLAPR